jgi:hypothetical protein
MMNSKIQIETVERRLREVPKVVETWLGAWRLIMAPPPAALKRAKQAIKDKDFAAAEEECKVSEHRPRARVHE